MRCSNARLRHAAIIVCALAATPVLAAPRAAHDDCNSSNADRNIAGCTRVLEDTTESDRVRAIAHVGRGLAWQSKGERDKAMVDFSAAIRLDPDDSLAWSDRGALWRELNDLDRAIADFTEAIRLNALPRSDLPGLGRVNVYANRGLAWQAKGDLDRALADFDEAVARDPRDTDAASFRAQVHLARHEYDAAVADLDTVIRLAPNQTRAWYMRGVIRYDRYMFASPMIEASDLDGAIADLSEVIRRDPNTTGAYYARAMAFTTNGDRPRAIADLTELIRRDPQNVTAYYARAVAFNAGGDNPHAIADLTAAARINPFNHDVITALKKLKPDYKAPENPFSSLEGVVADAPGKVARKK